jgi:hypothetical protein
MGVVAAVWRAHGGLVKGSRAVHRLLSWMVVPLLLLLGACNGDDTATAPEANDVDIEGAEDEDYSVDDQPDDAAASFVSPTDGDTVPSPVELQFAAEGVELAPAGAPVVGEGHLHVTVDLDCFEDGVFIPGPSEEHEEQGMFHLGDGSDSRTLDLEPGTYELCVQLADGVHAAFGETETIEITVE